MIEWIWPWMFALLPVPWLVYRYAPPGRSRDPALRAPFFNEWVALSASNEGSNRHQGLALRITLWLMWVALIAATARPVWMGEPVEIPNSGRDLMLAVDISGSMRIEDMQLGQVLTRRIDAVKQVGADFIERRKGDRLGLILFGSNAYVQSPLSFDTGTVRRFLMEAQIGFAGQETAIGDAIGLAVKRLKERPAESRVLMLLTDGQDTASSVRPLDAARLAADLGIRIYTIGIGADEMSVPGLFGTNFGSRQVNPSADLDEESLQQLASLSGGQYFRARNPQELVNIYQLLNQLEPVEQATVTYRPRQAMGYWPLLIALLLSFLIAVQQVWQAGGWTRPGSTPVSRGG
ncbi:MAG: VWA domain-containing protein [Halieaceae bacterium]|jgi:Ca-activated chloride channel homolog|nr:VWA domain-containing protein [Halieaceae bacterium]